MDKEKKRFVGIDISKDTFNAHCEGADYVYPNNSKGWRKMLREMALSPDAVCAMEATGTYHCRLADYLHGKGMVVKVFNPLRVHRWRQSFGHDKKTTDKICARDLAVFAETKQGQEVGEWKALPPKHARARVIVSLLAGLSKLATAGRNMNHAVSFMAGSGNKDLLGVMSYVSDVYKERAEALESELEQIVSEIFPEKFRLLQTIPSIGAKTAAHLLVCAKGMEFETPRQLAAFIGVVPYTKESGTSVKARGKIVKVGNSYLRGLLFMCAFTACRTCKPCAELYSRLLARGKPKMLAMIAVVHRLVKIAFGVVASGEPFRGGKLADTQ